MMTCPSCGRDIQHGNDCELPPFNSAIWERIRECVLELDAYCFCERLKPAGERQMHIQVILQKYFDVTAGVPNH